jgi:cyclophilin family peptidyl-prolyl cis-trans isomerase
LGFGLQFYITTRAELDYLDEKHTVCNSFPDSSNLCKDSNFMSNLSKFVLYVSRTLPHYLYKNISRWRIPVVNVVYVLFQVFGEVGEGLETLMRINEAFVDDNFRPYKNIR